MRLFIKNLVYMSNFKNAIESSKVVCEMLRGNRAFDIRRDIINKDIAFFNANKYCWMRKIKEMK